MFPDEPPGLHRPLVLLVTDDIDARRALQLLLRGSGFDVRAYASGWRLLSDTAALQARCLIAEDRMSDMDGAALLKLLRASGWCWPALLIARSGEHCPLGDFAAVLARGSVESRLVAYVRRLMGVKAGPEHPSS